MHFGELGNMAFLLPNYAKVVADLCKEQVFQCFRNTDPIQAEQKTGFVGRYLHKRYFVTLSFLEARTGFRVESDGLELGEVADRFLRILQCVDHDDPPGKFL